MTTNPANDRALFIERLALKARAAVFDKANRTLISLPELEEEIREFARRCAAEDPLPAPTIGFDRPANIYVATEFYPSGGHRRLLEQMVAARPQERHIVVFTGMFANTRDYSAARMAEIGAFPVQPDAGLTLADSHSWLRRRLAAYAAQRVILFHHPEDILAVAVAHELMPRYGRKLYVVRHSDTRPTLGAELTGATHIAIRAEQAAALKADRPGLACHVLPLCHSAVKASTRLLDGDFFHEYVFTTATAGGEHKFEAEGDLAFGEIVAGIIGASRGRHIHFGPVSETLKESAHQALARARVPENRLEFAGEVPSIAEALDSHKVDLFLSSFPIGGGLTVTEAAGAGLPIAVYDPAGDEAWRYIAGATHRPQESFSWTTPEALFAFLRQGADIDRLTAMARSSIEWYNRFLTPAKFASRLAAILAVSEGRMRGLIADFRDEVVDAVFDADFYLKRNKDVASAGIDPKQHFMAFGEGEKRSPNILFDVKHYLGQLSKGERRIARKSPITHYAMRGELRGLSPHPLFDPVLCGQTLQPEERELFILGSYVAAGRPVRAHTFFDEVHYARKRPPFDIQSGPLLAHFLETGADQRISPHPLIDMKRMGKRPLQGFLEYVGKPAPALDEPAPDPLFDPDHFCGGELCPWDAAAPNLLWGHVIAGNQRDTDPHPFVSVEHAARSDSDLFTGVQTVLERIARGTFTADTHPLISGSHIRRQAPWVRDSGQHPTRYFLEQAIAHNIDPHPCFSTQFYLYTNADVRENGVNPLLHYLRYGEVEGRAPHPFFDGPYYYRTHLAAQTQVKPQPLLHHVVSGTFAAVQPHEPGAAALGTRLAGVLFRQGDDAGAVELLRNALHPDTAPRHPTLVCEARKAVSTLEDGRSGTDLSPRQVVVRRPAIAHPTLDIAPASGAYECGGQYALHCRDAMVIGGNDGIVLKDGRMFDPGLAGFDPAIMRPKENGPVAEVAPDGDRVLIRRHRQGDAIPAGILACGTYSHNYYHFLVETLPRVMAASGIAPPDVPILTDDRMPAQQFQILRLLFPDRPIRRLVRGVTHAVGDLYVGSTPNVVHDAVEVEEAPCDAVRYHPEILRRLNAIAEGFRDSSAPRKVYFRRESKVRKMLNAAEIEKALAGRGFEIVQCDRISFAEQVRLAANAEVIVAQSGAHLANILFARPGTRVFALYSNAPGSNYYLWDGIGQALGLNVTAVAGWRIAGTTPPGIARLHEDFTLPLSLLLPLLPQEDEEETRVETEDLRGCLDALHAAGAEADTITSAWTIIAGPTPDGFEERLRRLRARAGALIEAASDQEVKGLLDHGFFVDSGRNIRSGLVAQADHSAEELEILDRVEAAFRALAETPGVSGDTAATAARLSEAQIERLLALVILYRPAWRMPLLPDISSLSPRLAERYAAWLATPPFLFRNGDDAAYAAYAARLLEWFETQFAADNPVAVKTLLYRTVTDLDLGQLFLVDQPLREVNAARNRLLDRFAPDEPVARPVPRPADGTRGKRRIGILCRTFDMGPDSEAIVSIFRAFDRSRFEIYAYSVGFRDRVVSADPVFAEEFDAAVQHRRLLVSDPAEMRARIVADDLDVFLHANATTYGLRAQELALYHRVAPVQMVLNSHLPMPMGFASFDAYVTGRSDDPQTEVAQEDYAERLIRCDGPVICYLNSLKPRPEPLFDRAAIGLSDADVVLMNAGSLSKLRHDCLRSMMMPLRDVPAARLLLAPYNPGWVARSQAFAFNRQVEEMAREMGIDRSRIIILGELSVAEAESALALCDIYLNPFPHGGATMTHLALINGKPPVTLRRRSTRSIDQFIIQSLGVHDVLAGSEAEYAAIAMRLAIDPDLRERLSQRILQAVQTPPFVNNPDYSRAMQEVIEHALDGLEC